MPQKSNNHLVFLNEFEYIIRKDEIYKCHIDNVLDPSGDRIGRFECTVAHVLEYRSVSPMAEIAEAIQNRY